MTNYLLIDGSYFIFYRYYALIQWWSLAKKEIPLENAIENEEFMEKFEKTFYSKLHEIPKKLNIDNPIVMVGKDCPRKSIWRMNIYDKYKENRVYDDSFMGGPIFKKIYKDDMFLKAGVNKILFCDQLEADDCIALTTKQILKIVPNAKIWIITRDMDYLQLSKSNIQLYNLKYKKLTDSKNSFNDAKKDLFCKIVMGDKSDGIPSVFKKCGIKTAEKCYNDNEFFKKKIEKENAYELYERNKKLVDFNYIPKNLVKLFKKKNKYIINGNNEWN